MPIHTHLVVYTITDTDVLILRVLVGRQDWLTILNAADLSR